MSVNLGTAMGYLDLDTSKFKKGFSSALSDLRAFRDETATSKDKLTSLSSAMTTTGSTLTKSLTIPLAAAGTAAVKATTDFQSGMSEVQAISGATAGEMGKLTDKAIEMGAKTKFSASESAEAFKYMAMAGWDTADMLDGIEGLMSLAAASGEDLATTSDIVTDALTAFGLSASESGHFADVLAMASSRSNTNVGLMGETFKYVAPVAGSLGYSIEDTATAIGLMANAGIKGSRAGTSLRAIFTRLVKPVGEAKTAVEELGISITNSDGTMKPFSQTMVELREKFDGMTESEKASYASMLAGQEAMSGLLSIVNASDEDFNKLTQEINNADGAAQEMASVMMDNLSGALEQASGAMETLAIKIGTVMTPVLTKIVNAFTGFVEKLTSASDGVIKFAVALGAVLASIGPLLLIFGKLSSSIISIMTAYEKLSKVLAAEQKFTTLNKLRELITGLPAKISTFTGSVRQLGSSFISLSTNAIKSTSAFISNTASIIANTTAQTVNSIATSRVGTAFSSATTKVLAFAAANKAAILATLGVAAPIVALIAYMHQTGASVDEVAMKITEFSENIAASISSFSQKAPEVIQSVTEALIQVVNSVSATIPTMLPVIAKAGVELFMGLVESLEQIIEPLVSAIPAVIEAVVSALPTLIPLIIGAGIKLFLGLVTSFAQVIPKIVSALPSLIGSICNGIVTLVPAIIQAGITLLSALIQAIPQVIPALVAAIPQIIIAIVQALLSMQAEIFKVGVDLLKQLWSGISSWAGALKSNVLSLAKELPKKVAAGLGTLISIGLAWLKSLWTGINNWALSLKTNVLNLAKDLVKKIASGLGSLFSKGIAWIKTLWSGISSWGASLKANVRSLAASLIGRITSGLGSLFSVGANWVTGLWNGMSSKVGWLIGQIRSLGSSALNAIKDFFGIHSPSVVMAKIGEFLTLGLGKGIVDKTSTLIYAIKTQAEQVKAAYKSLLPAEDFSPNGSDNPSNRPKNPKAIKKDVSGGDTYNFYSPKALTPMESARQLKKAKRELELGF